MKFHRRWWLMSFPNVTRRRRTGLPLLLLSGILVISPLRPQEPAVSITPRKVPLRHRTKGPSDIRMDVNMVMVPVTVTDLFDRPVTNLEVTSFRLFEDNIEQKILNIYKEDGPVSAGLLLDTSSSMKKRIEQSIAAIQRFFQSGMPGDEYFLVRFSNRPVVVAGFTAKPEEILRRLPNAPPQGWTALLDAIGLGVHEMKKARNSRRALIVLTDGGDNNSRFTESEIRDLVMESDVRLYAIGITDQYRFLEKLSTESGGKAYLAKKLDDLPGVIDHLSKDLRQDYILSYASTRQNDGKYRAVKVEVVPPPPVQRLNVVWKRGYYAPPD